MFKTLPVCIILFSDNILEMDAIGKVTNYLIYVVLFFLCWENYPFLIYLVLLYLYVVLSLFPAIPRQTIRHAYIQNIKQDGKFTFLFLDIPYQIFFS